MVTDNTSDFTVVAGPTKNIVGFETRCVSEDDWYKPFVDDFCEDEEPVCMLQRPSS